VLNRVMARGRRSGGVYSLGILQRTALAISNGGPRLCRRRHVDSEGGQVRFPSDFVACKLLKIGGSVCESNTPATSKMPPAGFEDRDDHRTACASVSPSSLIGPDSDLKGTLPNLSTPPIARATSRRRKVLLPSASDIFSPFGNALLPMHFRVFSRVFLPCRIQSFWYALENLDRPPFNGFRDL
jgi:hypothetical protein